MSTWKKARLTPNNGAEILPTVRTSERMTREAGLYDCFAKDYPEYFDGERVFTFSKELHGRRRRSGKARPISGTGVVTFNKSELEVGNIPVLAAVRLRLADNQELTNRFVSTETLNFQFLNIEGYCVRAIAAAANQHLSNDQQPLDTAMDTLGSEHDAFVRAFIFEDHDWPTKG